MRKIYYYTVGIMIIALIFGYQAYAESVNQPGSLNDPVVTQSYVDEQIVKQIAAEFAKQQGGASTVMPTQAPSTTTPMTSEQTLTVLKLDPTKTLLADAGTEIIVRTGHVIAVSNDENGIPDVTAGKDVAEGALLEHNHLLVFPTDKRGLKAAPNPGDIYLMIRGKYTITP